MSLGKLQPENAPMTRFGCYLDRAVQFTRRLLGDGKTETRTLILLAGPEPFEGSEYLLVIARINANSVVAYEQFIMLISRMGPADFDALLR